MTPLRFITPGPAPQTAIRPQRLLAATSSITIKLGAAALRAELLAHRITRTASLSTELKGYRHDGLNE